MARQKSLDTLFVNIRKTLFELINMIEIKIDVGYILEEIEEVKHQIVKLGGGRNELINDIEKTNIALYRKYESKLASFIPKKEAYNLINKIENWLKELLQLV